MRMSAVFFLWLKRNSIVEKIIKWVSSCHLPAFTRESHAFATSARPLIAFKLFENEEFGNAFWYVRLQMEGRGTKTAQFSRGSNLTKTRARETKWKPCSKKKDKQKRLRDWVIRWFLPNNNEWKEAESNKSKHRAERERGESQLRNVLKATT